MEPDDDLSYGRGEAAIHRRWLHELLWAMYQDNELPTTHSSSYYAGVQAKRWPSDAERKATVNPKTNKGYRRTFRQYVSDWTNELIEWGYVDPEWITDGSRSLSDWRSPHDLDQATYEYAQDVLLSPWLHRPEPMVIVESRSLQSALDGTAAEFSIVLAPLGGMGGRTFIRRDVWSKLDPRADVGFLGDWNQAGHDIENDVRHKLTEHGWRGDWHKLALTDEQAAGLPQVIKTDERYKPAQQFQSVEAEALGTTALRAALVTWLESLLPDGFTWVKHDRRTRTQRAKLLRRWT